MALLLSSELRALSRYVLESESARQQIRIAAGRDPQTSGPLMRAYGLFEEALTGYSANRIKAQDANAMFGGAAVSEAMPVKPRPPHDEPFGGSMARPRTTGERMAADVPVIVVGTLYVSTKGDPSDRPTAVGRVLMRNDAFQVVGLTPGLPWSDRNPTFGTLNAVEHYESKRGNPAKVVLLPSVVNALMGRTQAASAAALTPEQLTLIRTERDPR